MGSVGDTPVVQARTLATAKAYAAAEARYVGAHPQSQAAYQAATEDLPGGNTRTVLFFAPFPVYAQRARGCRLWDVDGHEYVDFLGEFSAGLYGHSDPVLTSVMADTLANGLSFGSQHPGEARLAHLIRRRFAGMDRLRFTNSGTEATLMALAAAKAFTGRRKIVVFDSAYHGGVFVFPGGQVHPVNVPHAWLVAQYNDAASVDALVHDPANRGDIAAILVEPMLGSGGGLCARPAFLQHLRQTASALGAVLIFDEVMTSRMYAGGGVQSELGIVPDMTTLGKYLGGGMSFGAFGGRKDIMALYDPRPAAASGSSSSSTTTTTTALPHAGTFNNNVLTMAAGAAGLERVFTPARARQLHADGDRLRARLNTLAEGTLLKVLGCGSILVVHFTATPVADILAPRDWKKDEIVQLLDLFHLEMLEAGIYLARRGYMALSLALGDAEFDKLVSAVEVFLDKYRDVLQCDGCE